MPSTSVPKKKYKPIGLCKSSRNKLLSKLKKINPYRKFSKSGVSNNKSMHNQCLMVPTNSRSNVILENTTKKNLQDCSITKISSDFIHGTRRTRNLPDARLSNDNYPSQLDRSINNSNDTTSGSNNDERDRDTKQSGGRLLNVNLRQLLLRRAFEEEQIDQFQQMASFTSCNPILPEIINQIERPIANLNESPISITNESRKSIVNQIEKSVINKNQKSSINQNQNKIINQSHTSVLDQSANSVISQKDKPVLSNNVKSISTEIDGTDKREEVSLPKIDDNEYLSIISQYFQSALDCQSEKEIAELARKSVMMKSESEAEQFINSIFDWMSQQVKERIQPLTIEKRECAARSLYWLVVPVLHYSYRAYSHYLSRSIGFIGENSGTPVWPFILLKVNMSLLMRAKQWDDLIGLFLDFARLRSLSLLSLVRIVNPQDLFCTEVIQSHSKLVEIVRRLVLLEHAIQSYSIINGSSKGGERIIDKLQPQVREIWLGGTQSVIESGDWCTASRRKECLTGILELTRQTIDQYRLEKNPLADRTVNLDKDIEAKFSK